MSYVREASRMRPVCDGCGASPDKDTVLAAGGLKNMGWLIRGRDHRCPPCKELVNA